jgi:glutathione S-transferase
MILIGMYDSPFVRRVAIALRLYGMPYEHRSWSVFRDREQIAAYNPLMRVPTLVLDDGEVIFDSTVILDALDDMAGRDRALIPAGGAARRAAMKVCATATSLGDKVVSLIYERRLHERVTPDWVDRCRAQIAGGLALLEKDRAARKSPWWYGDAIGHADIAVACVIRLAQDALDGGLDLSSFPALEAHCEKAEALPDFAATYQSFFAPPPKPA